MTRRERAKIGAEQPHHELQHRGRGHDAKPGDVALRGVHEGIADHGNQGRVAVEDGYGIRGGQGDEGDEDGASNHRPGAHLRRNGAGRASASLEGGVGDACTSEGDGLRAEGNGDTRADAPGTFTISHLT